MLVFRSICITILLCLGYLFSSGQTDTSAFVLSISGKTFHANEIVRKENLADFSSLEFVKTGTGQKFKPVHFIWTVTRMYGTSKSEFDLFTPGDAEQVRYQQLNLLINLALQDADDKTTLKLEALRFKELDKSLPADFEIRVR